MIKQAIHDVSENKDLSFTEAKEVMDEIMSGKTTPTQIASFLMGLRMKGETIDEITACATVMREKAVKLNPNFSVIDIVGTGGDELGTFNISTTSAFVVAAGGVPVAKHGNRSVSSKSGAADVLENLGVNLNLTAQQSQDILEKTKMCFLFAQSYHSSMKYAAPVRKELGIRTIFNILGPLANPAGATMQLLGVYDKKLVEPLAQVLSNLGVKRGMVVCGSDGLDEATVTGVTHVCEIRNGTLTMYDITPEEFGLQRYPLSQLIGGTPRENAQITKDILSCKETGAKREIVILNAALSLYLGTDSCTIKDCVQTATTLINSGKAQTTLETFVRATQEV
ncbi:MAG TPA: anthranilate phosphoribosyltransferase [Clostridiales bacterium]|nr:anthranilate phosphoribosyltransferase [Clostridiales bacterium]